MTTETLPVAAPLETVTPIKPSEAIRLGCLIAPVQAFGTARDGPESACVLYAFDLGAGNTTDSWYQRVLNRRRFSCPVGCFGDVSDGPSALVHLNDDHRWTRERIADWLSEQGL